MISAIEWKIVKCSTPNDLEQLSDEIKSRMDNQDPERARLLAIINSRRSRMNSPADQKRAARRAKKIAACSVSDAGEGWSVTSPSGSTYSVTIGVADDDDALFRYNCSCAARGECVHVSAVDAFRWAQVGGDNDPDCDLGDILERTLRGEK